MKKEKELVGVKEIARRASVSIATVDRVLHDRPGVSQKTKEKILAIIQELDYKPNILARRLASGRSLNIYTLIPEVSPETDYWSVPLQGILQAEREVSPYNICVHKLFYDMNDKQSFIRQTQKILESKTVDGVMIAPAFIQEATGFTNACQNRKIPFVFINSDIPGQRSLNYFGPDLFHSGHTAAHLVSYLVSEKEEMLLLNIAKDIDSDHHILQKEKGFMSYFSHRKENPVHKVNLYDTQYQAVKTALDDFLNERSGLRLIFVTNSRVSLVARYLDETNRKDILLLGYDFLESNIQYLNQGAIDFLICEKPQEQAYRGIKALHRFLMFEEQTDREYFMPIDIIHRENQSFYRN